jgi:hypothetical protein
MNNKVVISGATGLIGQKLVPALVKDGYDVTVLTRSIEQAKSVIPGAKEYLKWNYKTENADFVDGKNIIIHLAGENIMAKRWSPEHKKNVFESRILSTQKIIDGVIKANSKPSLLIHASAIGFYGTDANFADEKSEKGNGFLADVVSSWEIEAAKVEQLGLRRVGIRLGIVLDKNEGALKKMIPPFKFFIGGPLGSGNQPFPWIHIDDVISIFHLAIKNENVNGAINAVATDFITMNDFSSALGKILNRPSFFKVPEFVLKIILGEAAEAITKGVKVIPKRLEELKYQFKYDKIESALRDLLQR